MTTLHGTDITLVGNDPNYLETTRFGIVKSDVVTAVSEALRVETLERFDVSNEIHVVPNFIEEVRYERARERQGARRWARDDEKILVHVSNYRPVKRVLDVVEVFERVSREMPARLLLVGDGPDRPKVEQHCRRCDICDSITFVGHMAPVEEILVGADLFLLPSEIESFGLAALEALACKVPVIATSVGGLPEVVRHGVDGMLFEVGDVDAMGAAAVEILRDPERHARMAEAARQGAVERFSEDAIVGQYRGVYELALGL